MENKLCVIMSVYRKDDLKNLKLSVESILNQSYENFDFYIQLDGVVPDDLETYLDLLLDVRVKVFKREKNKGLAVSLNEMLNTVMPLKYKYIARMDADDISLEKRFEKQISFLEERTNVDILGCEALLINKESNVIGYKKVSKKITFKKLLKNCEVIHPSVMFRANVFDKIGVYDSYLKKSQDYDLWLRAAKMGIIINNIKEPLIQFRYERDLISRRKKEQKYNIIIKKKYLSGFYFYRAIMKHIIIMYMPSFVLKKILLLKIKQ